MTNILFEDVTHPSNTAARTGQSFGSSWGDFNGDALPDLWVTNHLHTPSLLINQGDGSFIDQTHSLFRVEPSGDGHGAAWVDIDNDGDQDLFQLVGAQNGAGIEPNRLYINHNGIFYDNAKALGIDYALGRGRTPFLIDVNDDGAIDLGVINAARKDGQAPPTVFQQTQNGFEIIEEDPFQLHDSNFCITSDLFNTGEFDLICHGKETETSRTALISYSGSDLSVQASNLISHLDARWVRDIAIADFNGDLRPDIYLARHQGGSTSSVAQSKSNEIKASLLPNQSEHGFRFKSTGVLTTALFSKVFSTDKIYLGETGINPNRRNFKLDPKDPLFHGIQEHRPGQDTGVYIGYDPTEKTWELLQSGPNAGRLAVTIQSTQNIKNVAEIGFLNSDYLLQDKLYLNTGDAFVDKTQAAGLGGILNNSTHVVSGDFDNDTDIDLYIVETSDASNSPNRLYENQGDGTFKVVKNAGGAAGTLLGVGDTVMTADYDLDGFLDLYVVNGKGPGPNANDGINQLFRNQGNQNHWLEIDLEGVISNRDGVGAKVYVTAGGVTQLREQNGGIHAFAQNHQRLHFGLAQQDRVEKIEIHWPSGIVQVLDPVASNQLIRVVETNNRFTAGKPDLVKGEDAGVYLWKETFDGPYQLRILGNEGASDHVEVNLISTDPLVDIQSIDLDASDHLTQSKFGFSLASISDDPADGVDFQLRPGTDALISVTHNGTVLHQKFHVGQTQNTPTPAGWILQSDQLPTRPPLSLDQDFGLWARQKEDNPNHIEFRWNESDRQQTTDVTVLAAEENITFGPVSLGEHDIMTSHQNGMSITTQGSPHLKGLDVKGPEATMLGLTYQTGGITPNPDHFGVKNAYDLPIANPYGRPEYDPTHETGVFLWKDMETDFWHLRAAAGGRKSHYQGSIVSDQPIDIVSGVSLEYNDDLDQSKPNQIDFEFNVQKVWQDGITFRLPMGASAKLNLSNNQDDPANLVKVGEQKWEVSALPLDLSGWSASVN